MNMTLACSLLPDTRNRRKFARLVLGISRAKAPSGREHIHMAKRRLSILGTRLEGHGGTICQSFLGMSDGMTRN